MNKRIFLFNPPSQAEPSSSPMGLACITAVLRKAGYEVLAVDASAPYNRKTPEQITGLIKEFDPLFIGVHLMYDFIYAKYALIRDLKKLGYPVVGGGPHVNLLAKEALTNGLDIVAIGEGEEVIEELATAFSNGTRLAAVKGLGYRTEDGQIAFTEPRPLIKDLDGLPFVDYDDFPIQDYTGRADYDSNKTYFNIFSSRGCPHRCTFCSSSRVWGRKYRWRSAQSLFDEFVYLQEKYGAYHFAFQDNEPLVNKKRMYAFCDLLEKGGIKAKISTRARIDNLDEDLLKRMMSVGFHKLAIGVESGDPETLRKVNRHYSRTDIQRSMEMLDRIKFPIIHFNNMIGFPWETRKHLNNTLRMNRAIPKTLKYYVNVIHPIPLPATPLYREYCDEYGFKEWWFNPARQKAVVANVEKLEERPLFQMFMPLLRVIKPKTSFWRYSPSMKHQMLVLQIKLQQMAYQRNPGISAVDIFIALACIRLSVFLYRFSPRMERLLLKPLKIPPLMRIANKLVFKRQ